jgi:hypothetical protein
MMKHCHETSFDTFRNAARQSVEGGPSVSAEAERKFLSSYSFLIRTYDWICNQRDRQHKEYCAAPSSMKTEQQGPDAAEAVAAIQPQHKLLPDVCRTADILVVAVGHAELVRHDWLCIR